MSNPPASIVQSPAAARVLLDADLRRWFQPFFGRATSVAEAARSLGEKPNSVLYRVNQWLELGLVRVEGEEPRRGRLIRLYRSAADAFFVPHRLSSSTDLLELQQMLNAPYLNQLYQGLVEVAQAHAPDWGVRFDAPHDGVARISAVPDPLRQTGLGDLVEAPTPSLWNIVPELRLEPADALAMRRELLEVVQKYRQKGGSSAYTCCVGLAPTQHAT